MSYETKVILLALATVVRETRDVEKIYDCLKELANADGITLKELDEKSE